MNNNPDEKIGDDYPGESIGHASVVAEAFPGVARLGPQKWKELAHPGDENDEPPSNPHEQEPNNKPS